MIEFLPPIQDSAHFTPEGRRLLQSMGVLEPDPLRVEAERWLARRKGRVTDADRAVRRALGPPVPEEWIQIAQEMRGVK